MQKTNKGTASPSHLHRWKGLDKERRPVFLDYIAVERMANALLARAAAWQPDLVGGIVRGGIVPASMVATGLGLPLALLAFDRTRNKPDWIGPVPEAKRVLLVDDGCSSGTTMQTVRDMLLAENRDVLTLAVVHDPDVGGFAPDLSHPMRELWRFPWERGEASPAANSRRAAGEWPEPKDELPFIGLDLDGVFLPDMAQKYYDADLDEALHRRDRLAPFVTLPGFAPERAVLITGRPEMDRARTLAWLEQWGHEKLPLEMRPETVINNPLSVARYKADTATRRGCSHFIESDPYQAILIAAEAPHLMVSLWDGLTGASYVVGAAAAR